jgi:hypothetical protein
MLLSLNARELISTIETGAICIATGRPSATKNGFESIKTYLERLFKTVCNLCDADWKAPWETDSRNIVIVASSL